MKHADTDYLAIKPELVDDFFSLSSTGAKLNFEEREDVKSAIFCDVHADDWHVSFCHSVIDYHFLHPTAKNPSFYDEEAIEKTLKAMHALDWNVFDKQAHEQITEAQEGEASDWFGIDFYPSVQALFEHAKANNLYVVSFFDDSNMEGFADDEEDFY